MPSGPGRRRFGRPGPDGAFTTQCRRVRLRVVSTALPRTSRPALAAAGNSGPAPVSASFPPLDDVADADGVAPPTGLALEVEVPVAVGVPVAVAFIEDPALDDALAVGVALADIALTPLT
jgi:hypothetical protein